MSPQKLQLLVDAAHLAQSAYYPTWCEGGGPYTQWELYEDCGSGSRVFVANRGSAVDITFTGTQWWDLRDWLTNFKAWSASSPLFKGRVHRGYRDAYDSVKSFIHAKLSVLEAEFGLLSIRIAGHSNGGALAVFCAQDLASRPHKLYAAGFGTPSILSSRARRDLRCAFYNVISAGDLVPVVSRGRWKPAGTRIYVDRKSNVFEYTGELITRLSWCLRSSRGMLTFKPHAMQRYIDLLSCAL